MVCVWSVCGLCVVCVWSVCGLCVVCVWSVCGLCVICVWSVCSVYLYSLVPSLLCNVLSAVEVSVPLYQILS